MTTPHLLPDRRSPPSSNEPIALAHPMIDAISRARAFAPAATPVVLHGESGSGKTFFADFIHHLSQRPGGFHACSVGTLAPQLALDELFGHVPGAFTDARRMRAGLIATAGGGTLLLDDMQALDLGVQRQLLQVLDRGTYRAGGCDRLLSVACRIIFAMTEEPDELMKRGMLLKDLRYRFGECAIRIPPLRERREEIALLAQRGLARCREETKVDGPMRFSDSALVMLCEGEYNGNVRQLEGIVRCAYLVAREQEALEIDVQHLPAAPTRRLQYMRRGDREENRIVVERVLRMTGGNIKKAARLLGVSRNTVRAVRTIRSAQSGLKT